MVAVAEAGRGFSERLVDFQDILDCRRLVTGRDLETAYRLRYDAYVREGAISRNFTKRFADSYDESPNVWILGTFIDGEMASSIRIHVLSPEHPEGPGMPVFSDLLRPEIERGLTIIDPTRFVANETLARRYPELPYATVRLCFLASEFFEADIALATVRAEHQAFYRRVFGFKALCPPREYPSLAKPISLMAIHCPTFRGSVLERNPFLHSSAAERSKLFGAESTLPTHAPPMQPALNVLGGRGVSPEQTAG